MKFHLRGLSVTHPDKAGELARGNTLTVWFLKSVVMSVMILEHTLSRAAHYIWLSLASTESLMMLCGLPHCHRHRQHAIQVLVGLCGTEVRLSDWESTWLRRSRPLLLLLREASPMQMLHVKAVRFWLRRYIRLHSHPSRRTFPCWRIMSQNRRQMKWLHILLVSLQ